MKLKDLLVQELPKRGGWPDGCVAISLSARGQLWPHSKMPTRYRDILGVWSDDNFWGDTTAGFSRPIFSITMQGNSSNRPVTKEEYLTAAGEIPGVKLDV